MTFYMQVNGGRGSGMQVLTTTR